MHPDNCEWCKGYITGQTMGITFTQEALNELFNLYNRSGPNEKANLWELHRRGNEWPKAGDKRGEFCSSRCWQQAVNSNFFGKWQSRGWFW